MIDVDVAAYLWQWRLVRDGEPIRTRSSVLLPVRRDGEPAMLKMATVPEAREGSRLMIHWRGVGAARVLAHDPDVLLLERAMGQRSLSSMAMQGNDDAATSILCDAVARLHDGRRSALPELASLSDKFEALYAVADDGILGRCAAAARALLADPREIVALHGDVHHDNVLDFGARGWLAIDPKGLQGERGFDYANVFCNPTFELAVAPGRLARQVHIVARSAQLDRGRLLHWILAWAGLSAAWHLEDGDADPVEPTLRIAEIAAEEIARGGFATADPGSGTPGVDLTPQDRGRPGRIG